MFTNGITEDIICQVIFDSVTAGSFLAIHERNNLNCDLMFRSQNCVSEAIFALGGIAVKVQAFNRVAYKLCLVTVGDYMLDWTCGGPELIPLFLSVGVSTLKVAEYYCCLLI